MLELGLKVLLAYLLGSVMGAMLLGAARGVDIREQGSGNAGGTNALRTQGWLFAAGVVVIDVAKGMLAAGSLAGWAMPFIGADPEIARDWLAAGCGLAVAMGHVWPVFHEFRGGKAGATFIGALAMLAPEALPVALAAWLATVLLTGYVGLGTMIAAATVPLCLWLLPGPAAALIAYGLAMTALIGWAHRGNIGRMRSGTEVRAMKMWLLRPRGSAP